jgi:hypothetical protein
MKKAPSTRRILVILTNRWDRNRKPRFVELTADDEGNVHRERPLKVQPRKPVYDEVWENDEGKSEWSVCNRFRKRYPHPLQSPR